MAVLGRDVEVDVAVDVGGVGDGSGCTWSGGLEFETG